MPLFISTRRLKFSATISEAHRYALGSIRQGGFIIFHFKIGNGVHLDDRVMQHYTMLARDATTSA
jgi:hypothetical protein